MTENKRLADNATSIYHMDVLKGVIAYSLHMTKFNPLVDQYHRISTVLQATKIKDNVSSRVDRAADEGFLYFDDSSGEYVFRAMQLPELRVIGTKHENIFSPLDEPRHALIDIALKKRAEEKTRMYDAILFLIRKYQPTNDRINSWYAKHGNQTMREVIWPTLFGHSAWMFKQVDLFNYIENKNWTRIN